MEGFVAEINLFTVKWGENLFLSNLCKCYILASLNTNLEKEGKGSFDLIQVLTLQVVS